MTALVEVADDWPEIGGDLPDPAAMLDVLRAHLRRGETYLARVTLRWAGAGTDPLAGLPCDEGVVALTCRTLPDGGGLAIGLRREGSEAESVEVALRPGRLVAFRPSLWQARLIGRPAAACGGAAWADLHLLGRPGV